MRSEGFLAVGLGVLLALASGNALAGAPGIEKWSFPAGIVGILTKDVLSSPAIGADGTISVGLGETLFAIYSDFPGLAHSPWAMFRHNLKHTARILPINITPSISLLLDEK